MQTIGADHRTTESFEAASSAFPLFSLPPELISNIFAFVCEPNVIDKDGIYHRTIQPVTPLFLGTICHEWRAFVWGEPVLWSFVLISLPSSMRRRASQYHLVQEWLARTGTLPLSIILTSDGFDKGDESFLGDYPPGDIYGVLATYAERWYHVELLLPGEYCEPNNWRALLSSISNRLSLLYSLTLRPPLHLTVGKVDIDMFDSASLLRLASVQTFYLEIVSLPWEQLLSVDIRDSPLIECLEVLRKSSNLIQCQFKDIFGEDSVGPKTQGLHLPFVSSFAVRGSTPFLMVSLLASVSCPALQGLILETNNDWASMIADDFFPHVTSFIFKSSSPALRSLSLSMGQLSRDKSLIQCLFTLPSLESLRICSIKRDVPFRGLSKTFLDRLDPRAASSDDDILLPNLYEFTYEGHVDFTPSNLIDVLRCRWERDAWRSIRKLKFARIVVHRLGSSAAKFRRSSPSIFELSEEDAIKVRNLVEDGMELSIRYA